MTEDCGKWVGVSGGRIGAVTLSDSRMRKESCLFFRQYFTSFVLICSSNMKIGRLFAVVESPCSCSIIERQPVFVISRVAGTKPRELDRCTRTLYPSLIKPHPFTWVFVTDQSCHPKDVFGWPSFPLFGLPFHERMCSLLSRNRKLSPS